MDAISLLKSHRSIRKYTEEPVPEDTLADIISAGFAAATSSNLQGTTVIRVRNPETRSAIAAVAGGQTQVETAAAFYVWCADLHRSAVACEANGGEFSAGMTEHFMIATVDCALAAQNAVVAAESLGHGICNNGGIRNDPAQVTELLRLPQQVYPLFGLCIGWPDQDPELKPRLPCRSRSRKSSTTSVPTPRASPPTTRRCGRTTTLAPAARSIESGRPTCTLCSARRAAPTCATSWPPKASPCADRHSGPAKAPGLRTLSRAQPRRLPRSRTPTAKLRGSVRPAARNPGGLLELTVARRFTSTPHSGCCRGCGAGRG
ncbi:MAG: NADPH-dependent oxidoreductase [Acidimicrobiales bacterium]